MSKRKVDAYDERLRAVVIGLTWKYRANPDEGKTKGRATRGK